MHTTRAVLTGLDLEFVVGHESDKRTLVLRDNQHEYVFTRNRTSGGEATSTTLAADVLVVPTIGL